MTRMFPIKLTGTHQLPEKLVWSMWDDYNLPLSLCALGIKYARTRGAIREIFVKRGLKVRPVSTRPAYDPLTGRVLKLPPATPAQIAAMIADLTYIKVPTALKREWRQWSWDKRGKFLARLRVKFKTNHDRPETPFSTNVEPFDYCTPRAHEIERQANAGIGGTRNTRIKIKLVSWGVIWRDQLFYWHGKVESDCGYVSGMSGPYEPGIGRPLLHRLIWEDHNHQKVPAQTTVIHLDGNKNNLAPENLALRTMAECARINRGRALIKQGRSGLADLLNQYNKK